MSDLTPSEQESTVEELKTRFDYASREWAEIREQGRIDVRCVAGDVWDPKERKLREDAKRPCLSLDELGQYVNQLINEVRQHKRAIKVTPIGTGGKDAIARLRANLIRQIEYRSNAQIAYTSMFENTVQRSYGFLRIKSRYEHPRSMYQELVVEDFPNPDMVTPDPDDLSPVGADMKFAFVHEWWSVPEFRRRWPNAKVKGADPVHKKDAPKWWNADRLQVAEYWTIEPESRELLHLQHAQGYTAVFADELVQPADDANPAEQKRWLQRFGQLAADYQQGKAVKVDSRTVDDYPCVYQYMTNGIELLPPNPSKPTQFKVKWSGTSIPIVACYGKVLWVADGAGATEKDRNILGPEDGSGATRQILSLVRLARDPAMLYAFTRTQEAELVGMTPKTPFVGYVGQFRSRRDDWQKVNHEPLAFLEADPTTEETGAQILPLPVRQPYDPALDKLEMLAESARRAIQAAMGIMPLPTNAQRQNDKSGIALERIKATSQQGSFHFVDHYEMAITRTGAILDELLPYYYDAARDVTIRKPDDETASVRINDPQAIDEESGAPLMLRPEDIHDVTLSTGPSQDSEREAANEFTDAIVENIQQIAPLIGPQAAAKLIALAIKLKNVGPFGDQMAEIISPQQKNSPEQLQAQLQEAMQMVQALQVELAEAKQIIETDAVKAQQQADIAKFKAETDGQIKILQMQQELATKLQELEVKLEIELAKIGSAQALARGEAEMQQLHHHDEVALREQELNQKDAQQTLDRQAQQEQADKDRVAKSETAGVSSRATE